MLRVLGSSAKIYFQRAILRDINLRAAFRGENWKFFDRIDIRTVVNIGAEEGDLSVLWALRWPQSKVYSIESDFEEFDILQKNALSMEQVVPCLFAVVTRFGPVRTKRRDLLGGTFSLPACWQPRFENVPEKTLGELFSALGLVDGVDILRINLRGLAYELISENVPWIARNVKVVVVFYPSPILGGPETHKINSILLLRGFFDAKLGAEREVFVASRVVSGLGLFPEFSGGGKE